ncbi:hypothetical protein CSA37_07205 [Candidatus Fermentibacteria bacterium]|nr:MAG: hypothetical protein CSA37_10100 [Candidatus Fermentibacteria bacterium]PIE52345.1 MAG: hypothetical protein CSA37_07205 [Candidatus Fermentibacteria bacterium]
MNEAVLSILPVVDNTASIVTGFSELYQYGKVIVARREINWLKKYLHLPEFQEIPDNYWQLVPVLQVDKTSVTKSKAHARVTLPCLCFCRRVS